MIDLKGEKEPNNKRIINDIKWIRRKYNLADALTKASALHEFVEGVEKKQSYYEIEMLVNRKVRLPTNGKNGSRVRKFTVGYRKMLISQELQNLVRKSVHRNIG